MWLTRSRALILAVVLSALVLFSVGVYEAVFGLGAAAFAVQLGGHEAG